MYSYHEKENGSGNHGWRRKIKTREGPDQAESSLNGTE
jgi:hypothetical protein